MGENTKNNTEEWRKMADTHKMSPEEVKKAGVEASRRPPGHNPGGVLHQRRSLPFSLKTMTIAGTAITAAMLYFTLYVKKKPEVTALELAKVATGLGSKEDTHPPNVYEDLVKDVSKQR